MTTIKWLLLTILMLPFLELAVFFIVATQVGYSLAFLFLFVTSLAGMILLRYAGARRVSVLRVALGHGTLTSVQSEKAGGLVLLAGFLLLIPGFITDLAGFLLLLAAPWYRYIGARHNPDDKVIDLESEHWHRVSEPKLPPRK